VKVPSVSTVYLPQIGLIEYLDQQHVLRPDDVVDDRLRRRATADQDEQQSTEQTSHGSHRQNPKETVPPKRRLS